MPNWNNSHIPTRQCVICGADFKPKDKSLKQISCSAECAAIRKQEYRGKANKKEANKPIPKKFLVRGLKYEDSISSPMGGL